jgi:hypothetical protein
MNHIHYQPARAQRDDLLAEAANRRRAREGAASPRFGHSRVRVRLAAPTSPFKGAPLRRKATPRRGEPK